MELKDIKKEWVDRNKYARNYAHFDKKVSLKNVFDYIKVPDNIKKHGFYPFIHYEKKIRKYVKENGEKRIKIKLRNLCYSAHIDRYIYSYYGYLINQKYNDYVKEHDIDTVTVAYRDNLHKSNINFAKEAFDFIKESKECFIIIGDFSDFFDKLDHQYLKKRLCTVLECDKLPDDYYAVFKNITKFSIWKLEDILEINGLTNNAVNIKKLNRKNKVLTANQFKKFKSKCVKKNKHNYGIPQGSAISAVLANVYMIEFDEKINELVKSKEGLYMRYSDDFIIVLPHLNEKEINNEIKNIKFIVNSIPNLILQKEKTKKYKYRLGDLKNCNSQIESNKDEIDYLGFTFDGKNITIRDRAVSKYYYKMYRKLNTIVKNNGYTYKHKRISAKDLYKKYSIKGAYVTDKTKYKEGNFLTYVKRAERIFGKDEAISRKTRRHMLKIRRVLDKVFK